MKIMTTAAFSVGLLGRRLSKMKWLALLCLAVGVGIVQIQTATGNTSSSHHARSETVGSAAAAAPAHMHQMFPLKGFAAVSAACVTSGLAGVYFEMVLKGSKTDLWVRNVQLSLFSIIPAVLPILYNTSRSTHGFFGEFFKNFGAWAWATVVIQVFGGLVTAVVIKYSDNILKGFATSLSIIISFLASVFLFQFHITPAFLVGSSIVLAATWIYNQPAPKEPLISVTREKEAYALGDPVGRDEPILGEKSIRKSSSFASSTQSLVSFFGRSTSGSIRGTSDDEAYYTAGSSTHLPLSLSVTPFASREPSPPNSEPSTPGGSTTAHLTAGQWRL